MQYKKICSYNLETDQNFRTTLKYPIISPLKNNNKISIKN